MQVKKIILFVIFVLLVVILPITSMANENQISTPYMEDKNQEDERELEKIEENVENHKKPQETFIYDETGNNNNINTLSLPIQTIGTTYKVGDNATAVLNDGVLTITGTGKMTEFSYQKTPWYSIKDKITSVVVKSGITSIGKYSFCECSNINSVTLPDTITSISDYAFSYCNKLTSVKLPSAITTIGYGAFGDCPFTTITLPSKLKTLGDFAFQGAKITTVTLPASLTSLSTSAFRKCNSLTKIKVESTNKTYKEINGVLFTIDGKKLYLYPEGKQEETYTIPSTVTEIGESAFFYSKLKTISIPNTVTKMGDDVFCYSAITSVTIGTGIKEIPLYAFYQCYNLKNVNIGKNVEYIWHFAFAYCTSLKKITIPGNVTDLRNAALAECSSLEKVTFGTPSRLQEISFQAFMYDDALKTVIIPEGIKEINRQAFYNCTSLQSLSLPSTLTFIGEDALYKVPTTAYKVPKHLKQLSDTSYKIVDEIQITGTQKNDYAFKVLELVNNERTKQGLAKLTMDKDLLECANQRAAELAVLFSHTRTDGTIATSINSKVYGENIAFGYSDPDKVMVGWMNSQGHRENILTSSYKTIGIGCFQHNGYLYWVQLFGKNNLVNVSKPANATKSIKINILPEEFQEATQGSIVFGERATYLFKLTLEGGSSKVAKGETRNLKVKINNPGQNGLYAYIDNASIKWNSQNPSVISVSTAGKITGKSLGGTKISASTGHLSVANTYQVSPPKVQNLRATSRTTSRIKYKWDAVSGVTGYKVYTYNYSTAKWEYYGKTFEPSIIVKGLENGTIYKIKVRAYKNIDGVQYFGDYSTAIRTATMPKQEKITSTATTTGNASLKWRKLGNATGYKVYMATSKNGTYERIKTVEKNTILYKKGGLQSGKTYYFKVRAYKTVDGVQIFGEYSPVVAIKVK